MHRATVSRDQLRRSGEVAAVPGGVAGLTELLNLNFQTLTPQDLKTGGDGNKTIDGKTFYVDNEAAALQFAITAAGLELDHGLGATLTYGVTHSGPILGIRLPALGVTWSDLALLRAQMIISTNPDANSKRAFIGFENKQAGGFSSPSYQQWQHSQQYYNTNNWLISAAGNAAPTAVQNASGLADDVWGIQINSNGNAVMFSGASVGGDFPPNFATAMTVRGAGNFTNLAAFAYNLLVAEMSVFLGIDTGNVGGLVFENTITRLKVEAK